jgi:DNA-binding MarR family transcriptional regulator
MHEDTIEQDDTSPPDTQSKETRRADEAYLEAIGSLLALHRYLRRASKARSSAGISGRQLATLRLLQDAGALSVGALAKNLFISEAATSELVGKLESWNLVKRIRADGDNRVVRVSVTAEGALVAEQTPLAGVPLLRERMKDLTVDELQSITRSIRILLDILEISDE